MDFSFKWVKCIPQVKIFLEHHSLAVRPYDMLCANDNKVFLASLNKKCYTKILPFSASFRISAMF